MWPPQVCHQYRREGWLLPLMQALVSLREVAQRLRLPAEHVCYSLEIAALATQLQLQLPQLRSTSISATTGARTSACGSTNSGGPAAASSLSHTRSSSSIAEDRRAAAAAAAATVSVAVAEKASCAARVVDPLAAIAACRSAVSTLMTGVSEIKQGIMKAAAAAAPTTPLSPTESHAGGGGGSADGAAAAQSVSGALQVQAPAVSNGGLPRHFHYTVRRGLPSSSSPAVPSASNVCPGFSFGGCAAAPGNSLLGNR
jgi:hypothetical protein